jgi:intracellular multiplication protein IcmV
MKVTNRIGKLIKPFVNFPRWMNLAQLWANGRAIVKSIRDLKVHRPPVRKESFEEAIARLQLSEEDVKARQKNCLILSILYASFALLFLIYTVYLIIHGSLGMIIGLLITSLMTTFAYREHFWYFQLKTRTLGNTFRDWVSFLLRGGRK